MHPLRSLLDSTPRLVAGLMSGTSLDGVDAVIAQLAGSGPDLSIDQRAFVHVSYPEALRSMLLQNSDPQLSSVKDLSQLNVRLAHVYEAAVRRALDEIHLDPADLDLVGAHGQTMYHVPDTADCAGEAVTSTLQLGDPTVLANRLGVPVVGNFRPADMALGGQGAPLVPYFDYIYFTDANETRALLNLGGIANLTLLPAAGTRGDVQAFDTGPANMVIDALAERLFNEPYDEDGARAAQGSRDHTLLAELLQIDFFEAPPPKSTGRERFGMDFVEHLMQRGAARGCSDHDLMATATALTAYSVYQAYARFLRADAPIDVLIAAGGGIHNRTLMRLLAEAFAPIPVRTADAYGLNPDAKEALCFAVLAHETLNGVPTNLPRVTGARHATLLGAICVPGSGG